MPASKVIRWGGLALLLGGVLWGMQKIGWGLFIGEQDPRTYPQPEATILWVMVLVANLFVLLGLPALYARQAKQAGRAGLIAFVVVFTGMAFRTGNAYFGTFVQAGLVDLIIQVEEAGMTVQEPVAFGVGFLTALALYTLGWLFFGVVSLRTRVLPRWPVALVLVGLVSGILFLATGFSVLAVPVTDIGIAFLGWMLWQERGEITAQATPTSELT